MTESGEARTIALLDVVLKGNKLQVGDPETGESFLTGVVDLNTPDNFTLIVKFGPVGVMSIVVDKEVT